MNVFDYLSWRGDLTFLQAPFSEVDNLLISLLSYVDLNGIFPDQEDQKDGLPLKEISDRFFFLHSAKELKNVASGDLGLETEDEKKAAEDATKENEGLFGAMKEALGDSVTKVAVSTKLATAEAAPACITAEGPVSLEMEKILSQMPDMGEAPKSNRVLEINAVHPVFATLKAAQEAGDAEKVKTYASLLYNQALLVEGMPLEDPVAFANAVASLMK